MQMDLTVEMDLDLIDISRSGYTILDMMSDVGGLQGILLSFCFVLIMIWNHNHFDNYLASRLFKIKDNSGD